MLKIITTTIIIILFSNLVNAQYLTLDKLIQLRASNLEIVEEYLTNYKWIFHESKAETDTTLGVVQFAYNRNNYDESSVQLWLSYISHSNEGLKRIVYELHVPVEYYKLITRAKFKGYKPISNKIKDDEVIKVYQNGNSIIVFEYRTTKNSIDSHIHTDFKLMILNKFDYFDNVIRKL